MEIIYKPLLPEKPRPIIVIGAGGIVHDAHLPAYRKAGFKVCALVNRTKEKAEKLAGEFDVPHTFGSVAEAVTQAPPDAVYDIAVMPPQYPAILEALPEGSPVLIQKPMGDSLEAAENILRICRRKKLKAAINCQLRYAPFVSAARFLIDQDLIGELYDMEVRLTTYTPWDIFPHVAVHDRLEILYHSIHYMDLIRSFLGDPTRIMSATFKHPAKIFSSTRTTTLLDYGDTLRAVINTNHDHDFGARNQESFIKWEGTRGAIKAKMGLLLNYPDGVPDHFEYCLTEEGKTPVWESLSLEGSWFPDAFIGTMSALMRYADGSESRLPISVEDVIYTMRMVEAAYQSNDHGGVSIDSK
jgi:predicted dehydrogenase